MSPPWTRREAASPTPDHDATEDRAREAFRAWIAAADVVRSELSSPSARWLVEVLGLSLAQQGTSVAIEGPLPGPPVLSRVLGQEPPPGWSALVDADADVRSFARPVLPDPQRAQRLVSAAHEAAASLPADVVAHTYAPHDEAEAVWREVDDTLRSSTSARLAVDRALTTPRWWPGREVPGRLPDPLGLKVGRRLQESEPDTHELWFEPLGRANDQVRRDDVDPVEWVQASLAYCARTLRGERR